MWMRGAAMQSDRTTAINSLPVSHTDRQLQVADSGQTLTATDTLNEFKGSYTENGISTV